MLGWFCVGAGQFPQIQSLFYYFLRSSFLNATVKEYQNWLTFAKDVVKIN